LPGATHRLITCKSKTEAEKALEAAKEELAKLKVKLNKDKTKIVDLTKGETFSFLGFVYRRVKTTKGKWAVAITPKIKARTTLLRKLKEIFARFVSKAPTK